MTAAPHSTLSPQTPVSQMLAAISGPLPSTPWPRGWEQWANTEEAHRILLDQAARATLRSPRPNEDGRAIVTCAGGATYFACGWIMVYVLRQLGCLLPVEWWHIGREELDPRMAELAQSLGDVELRNVAEEMEGEAQPPRFLDGWGAKVYALVRSRYAECLFLDADQVPAVEPTRAFDWEPYQRTGAVLWPDLTNPEGLDVTAQAFRTAGLDVPGNRSFRAHRRPADYCPIESGQVLVDRRRRLPELLLAWHICQHADYWWRHNAVGGGDNLIYGDKSAFLLAFERLRWERANPRICVAAQDTYARPSGPLWVGDDQGGAFLQLDFDGRLFTQHRCQPHQDKIRLHGDNVDVQLRNWDLVQAGLDRLRSLWSGKPWCFTGQTTDEARRARLVPGDYLLFEGKGEVGKRLMLGAAGAVQDAAGQVDHWSLRRDGEEDALILSSARKALWFLGRDHDGVWQNDGDQVALIPAPPADWICPDRMSVAMFHQINHRGEYPLPDQFRPGDIVLDLGANVGSFAYACLQRGAGHVHCVEPHPQLHRALRLNLNNWARRFTVWPMAVWHSLAHLRLGQPVGAQHSGGWAVGLGEPQVEAVGVPLDDLLEAVTADGINRVRLLKVDIEGAEFPSLMTADRLELVEEIVGEWHTAHCGQEALDLLTKKLASEGFLVTTTPHPRATGLGWFHGVRLYEPELAGEDTTIKEANGDCRAEDFVLRTTS